MSSISDFIRLTLKGLVPNTYPLSSPKNAVKSAQRAIAF
jgi:hypothetical protein